MTNLVKLVLEERRECLIWAIWEDLQIYLKLSYGFGGQSSQGARSQRRGPQQGDDLRYDLNIDFKDAVFGQQREIKIPHLEKCEVCKGTGSRPGTGPTTCTTCGGSGQVRRLLEHHLEILLKLRNVHPVMALVKLFLTHVQIVVGMGLNRLEKNYALISLQGLIQELN